MSELKVNITNTATLLSLHKDVQELCQPFLKELALGIMNMIRVDNQGRSTYLCDNYHWLKNYLGKQHPNIGACENNVTLRSGDYFSWSAFSKDDPIVIDSRQYFNLRHGITLVSKHDKGMDFFNYGVTNNNPSERDRLTALRPELLKFQAMFYEKGAKLFALADKHSYQLMQPTDQIIQKPLKRFHLGPAFDYQYLTDKELRCLQWLVQGKTIPEIAIILSTSERTAEKHIENVKRKFKCHTQCEIGYMVGKSGVDAYW